MFTTIIVAKKLLALLRKTFEYVDIAFIASTFWRSFHFFLKDKTTVSLKLMFISHFSYQAQNEVKDLLKFFSSDVETLTSYKGQSSA